MIDIHGEEPTTLVVSSQGYTQKITTIEQAFYWLRKKWPVTDLNRDIALDCIDAAMNCLVTVSTARKAFLSAAKSAGLMPDHMDAEMTVPF